MPPPLFTFSSSSSSPPTVVSSSESPRASPIGVTGHRRQSRGPDRRRLDLPAEEANLCLHSPISPTCAAIFSSHADAFLVEEEHRR
ncbi:hypothetical protein Droror1_Dr00026552 [Drosera rotundifolia]